MASLRFLLTGTACTLIANFKESDAARIVFFMEAFPLATANFPLGSGLGTFGGYSAFLFDSPLYHKLSFDYFYWYREGIWMTDTFYPHFLAETGYIGFICYVLSIVFLFKYLSESLTNDGKKVCFLLCAYMLLCAMTSPIMNDSLAIILCATIPVIFNKNRESNKINKYSDYV